MPIRWIPNALTLSRAVLAVIAAGAVLAGWPVLAFASFLLAALTDLFDGLAARALDAVSAFGTWLDPIADKLLVGLTLLALCWVERDWLLAVPTAVIILRDAMISRWRARLGGGHALPVLRLAKWKTAGAMLAIALLLAAPMVQGMAGGALWRGGLVCLWLAALASGLTGLAYARAVRAILSGPRT